MLDAIGAQEALEYHNKAAALRAGRGPSQVRADERERGSLARRRNAAERKLRDPERRAWNCWRAAGEAERAAVYAMLTDLPEKS